MYGSTTPRSLSLIFVPLLFTKTVLAQDGTNAPSLASNYSKVDIIGILESFDIQKRIKDMKNDGTLEDMVEIFGDLGTDIDSIDIDCMKDMATTVQGFVNLEMWAIQIVDAIGKPHTGILSDWDINWLGSYDECLDVKAITYSNITLKTDPVHHFVGKYCKIRLPLPEALSSLVGVLQLIGGGKIKVGVCVPDSCNTDDLKNIIGRVAKNLFNATANDIPDAVCDEGLPLENKTIVAICILSIFVLVVVIGTMYDIYLRLTDTSDIENGQNGIFKQKPSIDPNGNASFANGEKSNVKLITTLQTENIKDSQLRSSHQRSALEKVFLAFSAYSNGLKILNANQPKGALTCINGIRFFSMTWVLLGHSVDVNAKNGMPYLFGKKIWQWTYYAIYSATVSVDTFFAMSGLLVSYLTLREMSKRGGVKKMNWFMFYFHRYWRLTPVYMLVLMFNAVILQHLGDGPQWWWENGYPEGDNCAKYWWTNLLYINNYIPGETDGCLGQSWYLADDMQFYILSPLIIIPLFYNAALGGAVAGLFLIGTMGARAVITKQHEYTALLSALIGPKPKDSHFMDNLYLPTYTRIGPYIVGIVTGYLLYRYKDTFKLKRVWNLLGWLTCMAIITLIIYGVYPDHEKHFLSVDESVSYVTLHRIGWGVAVCWIIFACATGHGGWINDFLSWSPFGPLAKISYCVYLIHMMVLNYYMGSLRLNVYMTDLQQIYFYIGNVVISYLAAFVTSIVFEAPMMGLEKVFFKRP